MKIKKADLMRILREELTQHLTEAPVDMDMPDDTNTDMEVTRQDVEDEFEANTNQAEMARDLEMDQEPADMEQVMSEDNPWYVWDGGEKQGEQEDFDVGDHLARWMFGESLNIDAIVDALNEVNFFPELPHKKGPQQKEEPDQPDPNELEEGAFSDIVQTGLAHAYDAVTPTSDINYSQRLKTDRAAAAAAREPKGALKATDQQNVFNRRMSQVQDPYNESQDPFKRMRDIALKPYGSYNDED